jgi:hypothetical protein
LDAEGRGKRGERNKIKKEQWDAENAEKKRIIGRGWTRKTRREKKIEKE